MEAWFSSTSYGYKTDVASSNNSWDYAKRDYNEYEMSWFILTRLLDDIIKNCKLDKPITIFNDSRIIEELGGIDTLTPYAERTRSWMTKYQLPLLLCRFKKCSGEELRIKN